MYVQTYLDSALLEVSLLAVVFLVPVQLGTWLGGSWLPWWAVPWCFLFVVWFLYETSSFLGPDWMFHLLTCTMDFALIKRTCTA